MSTDGRTQLPDKPFHSKRPHRKTRAGCVNCKKRKIKCNEGKPSCSACLNRREHCEYQQAMLLRVPQQQPYQQDILLRPRQQSPPRPHPLSLPPSHLGEFRRELLPLLGTPSAPKQLQQQPLSTGPQPPVLSLLQRLYQPSKDKELMITQKLKQLADIIESESAVTGHLQYYQSHGDCFNSEQVGAIFAKRKDALCALLDNLRMIGIRNVHLCDSQMRLHPFHMPQYSSIETQGHFLQHFQLHTSRSFNVDPRDRRHSDSILRETAIRCSFELTSLMNCVMALSALHIKRRETAGDPGTISRLATEYSYTSTTQFLTDVEVADPNTFPHLVVASLLMTAISSEQFRDEHSEFDLFIVNWMKIWGGISIMMDRITIPRLVECGLSKLFYRPPLDLNAADEHIPQVLRQLVDDCPDAQYHDVYHATVRYLGTLYHNLKLGLSPMMKLRIITWITFIPKQFVQLAMKRHWRALVIVAHYAIFLKLTTRIWWMEGVGQRSIKDLVACLGPSKLLYIQVPIAALETEDFDYIGRLLLVDGAWEHEPSTRAFTSEEMLSFDARDTHVDDRGRATLNGES